MEIVSAACIAGIFLGASGGLSKVPAMTPDSPALRSLEIPGLARFEAGAGGLTRLAITSPLAEAHIYLHGGHVTHFQPRDQTPVLFLSGRSFFETGKPIRGGVPVCFPWFAARDGQPAAPAHGFARTMPWEVESLSVDGDQTVLAVLRLAANDETRAHWPHDFVLRHHITIGQRLAMMIEVENISREPFTCEAALHTYLAVADARAATVTGLENAAYRDKTDGLQTKVQPAEPLHFTGETDRIFENTRAACVLHDPSGARRITVEKSGSATTVVWNPWSEKAAAMKDFADDEWPRMACIETANAGANVITIAPGARHSMRAVVSVG